jgi:hypothetical protein
VVQLRRRAEKRPETLPKTYPEIESGEPPAE